MEKQKSFANLAKQFSESPQGKSGGDLGWIQEGHVITEVDKELKGYDWDERIFNSFFSFTKPFFDEDS